MYAKEVTALTWTVPTANGESPRSFKALYIFDDGFDSEESCHAALADFRYNPDHFATVYFCGQWYAVNMTDYKNFVVVSAENIIFSPNPFAGTILTVPLAEAMAALLPRTRPFDPGSKMWAEGIKKDMYEIDDNAAVRFGGFQLNRNSIFANNVLVTFGREFFKTEICIRTDAYVNTVFSNYYNSNSFCYILDKVNDKRSVGYEYYNPFTGDASCSKAESNQKKQQLLKKCRTIQNTEVKAMSAQNNIALDFQFLRLMKSGKPLYMRTAKPDRFTPGAIFGVKETWRQGKDGIEYIAETTENDPSAWCMSNYMQPSSIKRTVRVKRVVGYLPEEYGTLPFAGMETTYNRIPFYIDGVDYVRPLRQAGIAAAPVKPFWIVEFEAQDGFEEVIA